MPLAVAAIGPGALTDDTPSYAADSVTPDGGALAPSIGPIGNASDASQASSGYISVYTVQAGDTIKSVAEMFNVSQATIMWANDLTAKSTLKAGTTLTVPPVSGRIVVAKDGDTFASLSKRYGVPAGAIAYANDMSPGDALSAGDTIVVPDDSLDSPAVKPASKPASGKAAARPSTQRPSAGNYFIYPLPLAASHWVEGLHANCGCAVDIAAPIGTPIYAVADGVVTKTTTSGYNAGWGIYAIIEHKLPNGARAQTLSAHMSRIVATVGETVHAGDVIGYVGMTGMTTGPHLHIEVTGVANPFANPKYGR